MKRTRTYRVIIALWIPLTWMAHGQPDAPKNLKYFPADTSRQDLIAKMRNFSFALGVPCTHCHGTVEQNTSDLTGVDFSLDIKPTKQKAREMLRMVEQINTRLLAAVPHRSEWNLEVSCQTCHSGIPLPESIEARFIRQARTNGLPAALQDYRSLRGRYYGSAAYNFREQPLVEVASSFHAEAKYQEAAEISRLNLEFFPESTQSRFRLAESLFELGQTREAREIYLLLQDVPFLRERIRQRLDAIEKSPR